VATTSPLTVLGVDPAGTVDPAPEPGGGGPAGGWPPVSAGEGGTVVFGAAVLVADVIRDTGEDLKERTSHIPITVTAMAAAARRIRSSS